MPHKEYLMKRLPLDLLADLVGGFIFALGLNCFANPNGIAPGGVSGVAVILNHLFGLPLGATIFAINIPLLLLAWRFLGKEFTFLTLKTTFIQSVVIDGFAHYLPAYQGDMLLAALFGGLGCGAGIAIIFLRGSTTGGSDIISRLLQLKWPFMPIGRMMLLVDLVIVMASMAVFHDIEVGLYAIITIFVASKVVDTVMGGTNMGRMILIISDRHREISDAITKEMDRGATLLDAHGAFSGTSRPVIMCAVRNNEYHHLKEIVKHHDPKAFMITSTVNEVLGEGFASINEKSLS